MGKIRVKTFGNESEEAKNKAEKDIKRAEKKTRSANSEQAREEALEVQQTEQAQPTQEESKTTELASQGDALQGGDNNSVENENKPKKAKKEKFLKKINRRSANYSSNLLSIDKNKIYSLSDALELLRKMKLAKFDETVELHINTTEAGISGQVKLPHGTGKEIRVAIVNDEVLGEIEKGKINFDILIAEPSSMPKLAKVAKILGPKGLMPNPKNGTISANPEEAMKKFQGGQISFKTESKVPVIHLTVGKASFKNEELEENIKTIINAVKKDRIRNIVLKSTMSPAIKLHA